MNDPPSISTTGSALAYTEGDGPVAVDAGLTVERPGLGPALGRHRPDQLELPGAEDELAFVDQAGIAGSYDDTTGTLTLTGSATVAAYETALRSVSYENSSQNPSTAARTLSFQVTDTGGAASNIATRQVNVAGVNDAPLVTTSAGSTAYTEGDPADDGRRRR